MFLHEQNHKHRLHMELFSAHIVDLLASKVNRNFWTCLMKVGDPTRPPQNGLFRYYGKTSFRPQKFKICEIMLGKILARLIFVRNNVVWNLPGFVTVMWASRNLLPQPARENTYKTSTYLNGSPTLAERGTRLGGYPTFRANLHFAGVFCLPEVCLPVNAGTAEGMGLVGL